MPKESYLYRKLSQKRVQCQACSHYCVLSVGEKGKCAVRQNIDGKLVSLNYGKCVALNIDPIEKKPLFHFLPGTMSLSMASAGCNFQCLNCQNWQISQGPRLTGKIDGVDILPEQILEIALQESLPSISYTYTEPTIFLEYALDTMKLARQAGLKNIWVTNGFLSSQARDLIFPWLDAANVDLKSFEDEFYHKYVGATLSPVLDTLQEMKRHNIWLEVTTLIIPTLTDSPDNLKKIAGFIKDKLGSNTPWHISRFSPILSWRLKHLPETPEESLIRAWEIGKKAGLKYVYIGNAPELDRESTICPKCSSVVIERKGYFVKRFDKNGVCQKCGTKINGVFTGGRPL